MSPPGLSSDGRESLLIPILAVNLFASIIEVIVIGTLYGFGPETTSKLTRLAPAPTLYSEGTEKPWI